MLCRTVPSKSLMTSFMFVITSDSVSVMVCGSGFGVAGDCHREQEAQLRRGGDEGCNVHDGWDVCRTF